MDDPSYPRRDASAAIRATALGKSFGDRVALHDIDLEVRRGELFGVIGADGAGKTTLLRLLAGVLPPTHGRVNVLGRDTVHQAEALRGHVGYMAQQFSLYGDLTVVENLQFFADLFAVAEAVRRERLPRLLEAARLVDFRGRRAAQLSGGMQKKLALACALVHDPEVLLLDEPTTGVDPVSRREFWQILMNLGLAGMTIVVSTPYMEEADRCNRLAVLDRGRLLAGGPPHAIRAGVPGRLFEVQLDRLQEGREVLAGLPGVWGVDRWGDVLRVRAADDVTTDRLTEALRAAGLSVLRLRQVTPRMHEALAVLMAESRHPPVGSAPGHGDCHAAADSPRAQGGGAADGAAGPERQAGGFAGGASGS